jgi:hypothetical protein
MKKGILGLTLVVLVLGTALAATAAELPSSTRQLVALTVSFHRLVTDSEVQTFLKDNHALPFAVFTCAGDLCGVHRIAQSKASVGLVAEAREKAIEMEDNAERGIGGRAQSLIHGRSEKDFVANSDLVEQGQGLLRIAKSVDLLKARAIGGEAIIYGLQVLVSRADAEHLTSVAGITAAPGRLEFTKGGLRVVPPVPEQPINIATNRESKETTISAEEVYEEISRLSLKQ